MLGLASPIKNSWLTMPHVVRVDIAELEKECEKPLVILSLKHLHADAP
jgi:hypothetical protein